MSRDINSPLLSKLARLSNIQLSVEETSRLEKDLEQTLRYVANLQELDTNTAADYFTSENTVTFVDGTVNTRSLDLSKLLSNDIRQEFIVPKIL